MTFRTIGAALLMTLGGASSALAGTSSAVPEPSTLALFGLGALGVFIGRRGGHSRRD